MPITKPIPEKMKALQTLMQQMEKAHGKNAVILLDQDPEAGNIEVIPTGLLGLDRAIGVGGFPRGRIIEIYGPESSGKTTLSLLAIAQAQAAGGICGFVDAEHALDVEYAKKLGVDVSTVAFSQPDSGDAALMIVEKMVASGIMDVVVIDSVAALTPKAEIDGEMGEAHVGLHARLMSQALRKLSSQINRSKTCVIFLNQLRMKIGVPNGMNPETTSGGNALKFYASVRLDVRPGERIKEGEEVIGRKSTVKVVKNKVAAPFKKCEFSLYFDKGVSQDIEILNMGVELGLIEKSGAWYRIGKEPMGQGLDNAIAWLKANPKRRDELLTKVRESFARKPVEACEPIPDADGEEPSLEEEAAGA